MSYDTQREAIEQRFSDNWTTTPLTKVAWMNVPFAPPANDEWVRVTIRNGESNQITVGTKLHRNSGLIIIECRAPTGKGSKRALQLADAAAAIFRNASFSSIVCRSPVVQDIGPDGAYYQVNMTCGFYRDEVFV